MAVETVNEATSNEQVAVGFLRLVAVDGRPRDAFAKYVAPTFRHHDPSCGGAPEDLLAAMEADAQANPRKSLDVKRVLTENDLVAVHSHVVRWQGDPGFALVHLFRVRQGKIVELWSVGQPVPVTTPNPNGMF
jgi:predicted SnoaL-like aldol condensation-catalyzing enzyme